MINLLIKGATREMKIPYSTLYYWVQRKNESAGVKLKEKYSEQEQTILEKFEQQRSESVAVHDNDIKEWAIELGLKGSHG